MKKLFVSSFLTLFFIVQGFSQGNLSKIVGIYQYCDFPCRTIKLNADFTFDTLLSGDLFNNLRAKGIWKFAGKNKIYLKTFENAMKLGISEIVGTKNGKLKIEFIDLQGGLLPTVKVLSNKNNSEIICISDENGLCEIPKTEQIIISFGGQNHEYQLKNSEISELQIIIDITDNAQIEGTFVFKKNSLCEFETNGETTICYGKLKKSFEGKLFPPN